MSDHEPPPDPLDLANRAPAEPVGTTGGGGGVQARLDEIEKATEHLLGVVERMNRQVNAHDEILAEDDGSRTDKPAAWLHTDPPGESLPQWVAWFNQMYEPTQNVHEIPQCWSAHPGLLAELSTLWWTWRIAFIGRKASAEAAQNWHDRWLPGFQSRMDRWARKDCLLGNHKVASSPRAAATSSEEGRSGKRTAAAGSKTAVATAHQTDREQAGQ